MTDKNETARILEAMEAWEAPQVRVFRAEDLEKDAVRIMAGDSQVLKSDDIGSSDKDEPYR